LDDCFTLLPDIIYWCIASFWELYYKSRIDPESYACNILSSPCHDTLLRWSEITNILFLMRIFRFLSDQAIFYIPLLISFEKLRYIFIFTVIYIICLINLSFNSCRWNPSDIDHEAREYFRFLFLTFLQKNVIL
jgi:hypothetical protein